MRYIPSLLLLVLLTSCKKDIALQDQVVGKWELRTTFSGYSRTTMSYSVGNGNVIEFTGKTYTRYSNGQLDENGSYTLTDTVWHGSKGAVVYFGASNIPFFVVVKNSMLSMSIMAVDAGGSDYQKLR